MNWSLTVEWLAPRRQLVPVTATAVTLAHYAFLARGAALVVA
jgi:hypothetical protein